MLFSIIRDARSSAYCFTLTLWPSSTNIDFIIQSGTQLKVLCVLTRIRKVTNNCKKMKLIPECKKWRLHWPEKLLPQPEMENMEQMQHDPLHHKHRFIHKSFSCSSFFKQLLNVSMTFVTIAIEGSFSLNVIHLSASPSAFTINAPTSFNQNCLN